MSKIIKHKEYNHFIDLCEAKMQGAPLSDLPLKHYFSDGLYLREMFIPAGVMLTSKIHCTYHNYIVSAGAINIVTKEGIVKIVAPYTGENLPGTRRLGIALEDTIWTAIFSNPDNCKDIPTLERRLFKEHKNPLLKDKKVEEIKL